MPDDDANPYETRELSDFQVLSERENYPFHWIWVLIRRYVNKYHRPVTLSFQHCPTLQFGVSIWRIIYSSSLSRCLCHKISEAVLTSEIVLPIIINLDLYWYNWHFPISNMIRKSRAFNVDIKYDSMLLN
jgi:hypothetical protein